MYVVVARRPMQLRGQHYMPADGLGEIDGLFSSIKDVVKKVTKPIGSVIKTVAPIALPVAAAALAPMTGGASMMAMGAVAGLTQQQQQQQQQQQLQEQMYYQQQQPLMASVPTTAVPGQILSTGQMYYPQPSFWDEYKVPIIIGGVVIIGGGLIWGLKK